MKIIYTKCGYQVLVDDQDYEELNRYNWRISHGYAVWDTTKNGKFIRMRMHRLVLGLGNGKEDSRIVDHINRNKLDNRRKNLRIVSKSINNQNVGTRKDNTSGYKGVRYSPQEWRNKRWLAEIRHNNKRIAIGYFETAEKAYAAYCQKAIELRGFV